MGIPAWNLGRHITNSATYHPDIEKFIRDLVHPDGYRSPDEVVTEALYLLWQRDQADDAGAPDDACPNGRH